MKTNLFFLLIILLLFCTCKRDTEISYVEIEVTVVNDENNIIPLAPYDLCPEFIFDSVKNEVILYNNLLKEDINLNKVKTLYFIKYVFTDASDHIFKTGYLYENDSVSYSKLALSPSKNKSIRIINSKTGDTKVLFNESNGFRYKIGSDQINYILEKYKLIHNKPVKLVISNEEIECL